jgi:hypothetical protein
MPHIYLVSERTGAWPILSKERRRPPRDGSVRVELVAASDVEAEAWDALECLVEGRPVPES